MSKEKSILIVAAERGLGLGLVTQFFDRGWSVTGTARTNSDNVEALLNIGRSDPPRLAAEYVDVAQAEAIPSFQAALGEGSFDVIHECRDLWKSSHRASIAGNVEGGLELYRASKSAPEHAVAGNLCGIGPKGYTVLNIHPGWAATAMGTLNGTVAAEIDTETSVRGVADVVEKHMGGGKQLYLDY